MGSLVKHELYKIGSNKIALSITFLFIPIYVYLTYLHYTWNPQAIAWERIVDFPYSIGSMFEGIIIILALSGSFTQEYAFQMDSIIRSTKYGRTQAVTAKIIAALFIITIVVLGFWFMNIGVNIWMAGGTAGISLPLYELERYVQSPYSMSVWQYCLIQILTNLLGCIVLSLFTLFLSVRNKSILVVFFISGIVFVIPFLIHNFSELSLIWGMKNLLFTDLMRVENMFNRPRFIYKGDWTVNINIWFFYVYICSMAMFFLLNIHQRERK